MRCSNKNLNAPRPSVAAVNFVPLFLLAPKSVFLHGMAVYSAGGGGSSIIVHHFEVFIRSIRGEEKQ